MTQFTYTNKVLPLFTLSLFVASVGAFIGAQYLSFILQISIFLYILEFVLLFASFAAKRSQQVSGYLLFAFVFVTGLVTAPIIVYFSVLDGPSIVAQALFITCVVFAALSYYAYVSGDKFSRIGGFLFAGLIGIVVASLVNIFLHNTIVFFVVDILAIIIFSGYILYDTTRILTQFSDDQVYPAVMSLYIDFLNLFINILEILGFLERKK